MPFCVCYTALEKPIFFGSNASCDMCCLRCLGVALITALSTVLLLQAACFSSLPMPHVVSPMSTRRIAVSQEHVDRRRPTKKKTAQPSRLHPKRRSPNTSDQCFYLTRTGRRARKNRLRPYCSAKHGKTYRACVLYLVLRMPPRAVQTTTTQALEQIPSTPPHLTWLPRDTIACQGQPLRDEKSPPCSGGRLPCGHTRRRKGRPAFLPY